MYFRTTSARSGVRLKRVSAPDLTFTPRGRCICSSTARSKGGDRTNGRSTEGVVAGLLDRVSIGARADLRTRGKGKTQDQQRKRNCAKSFPIVIHNGFTRQSRRELVLLEQELVEFTREKLYGQAATPALASRTRQVLQQIQRVAEKSLRQEKKRVEGSLPFDR